MNNEGPVQAVAPAPGSLARHKHCGVVIGYFPSKTFAIVRDPTLTGAATASLESAYLYAVKDYSTEYSTMLCTDSGLAPRSQYNSVVC